MPRQGFRRGQVICFQGDAASAIYLLESGRVKVLLTTEDGEEVVLRVLGPGDVFGESALLDDAQGAWAGEPRCDTTCVALESTTVQVIDRVQLAEFLRARPELALRFTCALVNLIRRADQQLADLALRDTPRRLARKLLELAEDHGRQGPDGIHIEVQLTQSELASMIGSSRPTVNQILMAWEAQGITDRDGRCLILRRPEALELALAG